MKESVLYISIILLTIISFTTGYMLKPTPVAEKQSQSDFYNFGNYRVNKDSIYSVEPIYSEPREITGYYIEFQYNGIKQYVECLGFEGVGVSDQVESYLMPFKIADKEGL